VPKIVTSQKNNLNKVKRLFETIASWGQKYEIDGASLAKKLKMKYKITTLTNNQAIELLNILAKSGAKKLSTKDRKFFKREFGLTETPQTQASGSGGENAAAPRGGLRIVKPPLNNNEFANYIIKKYLNEAGVRESSSPLFGRPAASGLKLLWEQSKQREKPFKDVKKMLKEKIKIAVNGKYHKKFNTNFNLVS